MKLKDDYEKINGFFFDCDGVLWEENTLLPGAKELLETLTQKNKTICYLSNNSTKSLTQYLAKFHSLGLEVDSGQVITSSIVTVNYLALKNYKRKKLFIIGENGLKETLEQAGYQVVSEHEKEENIDAVIVGMDRNFSYKKLDLALKYCLEGADFIGTNPDPQFPTPHGFSPGAGSMIGALQSSLGYSPEKICGKPDPLMANIMLERFHLSPEKTVMLGDRVTTDMQLALNARINPILVKTGFGEEEYKKYTNFSYYKVIDSLLDLFN